MSLNHTLNEALLGAKTLTLRVLSAGIPSMFKKELRFRRSGRVWASVLVSGFFC